MEEHFLTYEQSLAVKELGFDEPCLAYYDVHKLICYTGMKDQNTNTFWNHFYNKNQFYAFSSPLKSQFLKWVRDKGYKPNIVNNVSSSKDGFYYFDLWLSGQLLCEPDYIFETYEQAEDACINKIIELLKNK